MPGQYLAFRYNSRLQDAGAVASIGSVGDSYDNAQAESLIGLYKLECVRPDRPWRTVDDSSSQRCPGSNDSLTTGSTAPWTTFHRSSSKNSTTV